VKKTAAATRPTRLSRDAVLRTAVDVADAEGIEAINMRNLADHLGVVPMALYKHVANKEELLDAMVDVVVAEIDMADPATLAWKQGVRLQILLARSVMLRHPWARRVIETRTARSVTVFAHLDRVSALFLVGGLTPDLVHHSMHAIGSRVWGFTQDVFDAPDTAPPDPETAAELVARFPQLAAVASAVRHHGDTTVGAGCDDQFEFEFALDLLLDGIERLHASAWSSTPSKPRRARRSTKG
jgi:AcrR family transcriptional regulator